MPDTLRCAERVDWGRLPDSSRASIARIVETLSDGFTGTIRLECNEGGVRDHVESRRLELRNRREDA